MSAAAAPTAATPELKEEKDTSSGGEGIKAVAVPSARVGDGGTVFYIIGVTGAFAKWSVAKRYSQFEDLQTAVLAEMNGKTLPAGCELPPKKFKLFTSHAAATFIEERRCLLEAYLKKVISVEKLAKSECVIRFLTGDKESKEDSTAPVVTTTSGAVGAGAAASSSSSSSSSSAAASATEEDKRRTGEDRDLPDDVEITGITIPATRTMSDHVLYQIDVCNNKKRKTFSKWTVLKRFGQFYDMDVALRESLLDNPDGLASLPGPPQRKAKLFNDHMDENFVEQRRVLLENFLNRLLEHPLAIRNKAFLSFLGVTV